MPAFCAGGVCVDVPVQCRGVGSGRCSTFGHSTSSVPAPHTCSLLVAWEVCFDRPSLYWWLILQMETLLCQVYFQIWTLLEYFAYFTRTGAKETTDFAIFKQSKQKKSFKNNLACFRKGGHSWNLESKVHVLSFLVFMNWRPQVLQTERSISR